MLYATRRFVPLFVTLLFAGCGGGGGGGSDGGGATNGAPLAVAQRNTAQGFWTGPTSNNQHAAIR